MNTTQCEICHKSISKAHIARHKLNVHGLKFQSTSDSRIQQCPRCSSRLTENNWKAHWTKQHPTEPYMTFSHYLKKHPFHQANQRLVAKVTTKKGHSFIKKVVETKLVCTQAFNPPFKTRRSLHIGNNPKKAFDQYNKLLSRIATYYSHLCTDNEVKFVEQVLHTSSQIFQFIFIGILNVHGYVITPKFCGQALISSLRYVDYLPIILEYEISEIGFLNTTGSSYLFFNPTGAWAARKFIDLDWTTKCGTWDVLSQWGLHLLLCLKYSPKYQRLYFFWQNAFLQHYNNIYLRNAYMVPWKDLQTIPQVLCSMIVRWRNTLLQKVPNWFQFCPESYLSEHGFLKEPESSQSEHTPEKKEKVKKIYKSDKYRRSKAIRNCCREMEIDGVSFSSKASSVQKLFFPLEKQRPSYHYEVTHLLKKMEGYQSQSESLSIQLEEEIEEIEDQIEEMEARNQEKEEKSQQ